MRVHTYERAHIRMCACICISISLTKEEMQWIDFSQLIDVVRWYFLTAWRGRYSIASRYIFNGLGGAVIAMPQYFFYFYFFKQISQKCITISGKMNSLK